jgi:transposase-like protein
VSYPSELKLRVLAATERSAINQVAALHGVSKETVYRWRKEAGTIKRIQLSEGERIQVAIWNQLISDTQDHNLRLRGMIEHIEMLRSSRSRQGSTSREGFVHFNRITK